LADFQVFCGLAYCCDFTSKFTAKHAISWGIQSKGDSRHEPEGEMHVEIFRQKMVEIAGGRISLIH
jgi:hypothetical protein